MAARGFPAPREIGMPGRSSETGGATDPRRSWLVDGCCLGAAAAGLALAVGFSRCEAGSAGTAALSTLAPIMQTRGHRPPAGCRRGRTSVTNVNAVR